MPDKYSFINVDEWAADKARDIKLTHKEDIEAYGGVYFALMENDDGWNIEIEVDDGTIAHIYYTGLEDLEEARRIADAIEDIFVVSGIHVYKSREEWEDALYSEG